LKSYSGAFIYLFNTQTSHIKTILQNSIAKFSSKPCTVAGFKPGSSIPDADEMSADFLQTFYDLPSTQWQMPPGDM
jgi:hypothetical protein